MRGVGVVGEKRAPEVGAGNGQGEAGPGQVPAASFGCVQCERVGEHVCLWSWRGVVLALTLTVVASALLTVVYDHCECALLSALYSLLAISSVGLLFHVQQLPSPQVDPFLSSFPSHLTRALFCVFAVQSLYLGLSQPFSVAFGCLITIALATFLSSSAEGVKYYLLSLLLSSAVYCSSFFTHTALDASLQLLSDEDEALAVGFLRDQFILYTPLFLTLLTLLLLTLQQWWSYSLSLLTSSITHHSQLKDAAMSASKLKSDFLANVSHDIRTPMNSILGFLQLAVGDQSLGDETRECLQTAFNSAEDLLSLLNDILDLSKIESGHLRFESIDFSLQSVYEKSVKTFAAQAQKKGVELIFEVDPQLHSPSLTQVKGDPSRLAQVVNNLLSNAVKFTSAPKDSSSHSEIIMRVSLLPAIQPGYIHIQTAVSDTGEGISAAGLSRIFQPFIQADQSVNRRHGGTGLGLAICSELVKLSGGRIWCQSEVGKGSNFCFTSQFEQIEHADASKLTDIFSTLAHDVLINDGNSADSSSTCPSSASLNSAESGLGSHAVSEPLPSRRIEHEHKVVQMRVLLAVHNPVNADMLSRAVSYWTTREYANCSATTPCARCNTPFTFNAQSPHGLTGHHHPGPSPSPHHTTFIEIVPSHRVATEHVVQELLWAKTTRQPYDLVVLDESAPNIDTVRVLQLMQRRRITQMGKPGVLILTTRLLSPVLRGNGASTYVLISKPVLTADINAALALLLRTAPEALKSMPLSTRRLEGPTPTTAPAPHVANHSVNHAVAAGPHKYVGSSRRPKDEALQVDVDEQEEAAPVEVGKGELHLDASIIAGTAVEDQQKLLEPYSLIREDHPASQHSTSAPNSPTGPGPLPSPTPSSAPVDSAAVYAPQPLPATPSINWDGRAQSFPDFFFPNSSSHNTSQSLTPTPVSTLTKPRSRSLSNALLPVETPPQPSLSREGTPRARQASMESVASGDADTAPPTAPQSLSTSDFVELHSDAAEGGQTPRSASASSTASAPASGVASPRLPSTLRGRASLLSGGEDHWPGSPPRHHIDGERLSRTTVSSVRRLLPTSQAVAQAVAGVDLLGGRSNLNSPVRTRTPSFSTSMTQTNSRSFSSTEASPALLSGPPSPASACADPFGSPPATNSPALGSSPLQPMPTQPRLARSTLHVLCVDDNKVNLKVASKMLQRLGYTPHPVSSGEEAIAFLDQLRAEAERLEGGLKEGEYPDLIRGQSAEEDARRREVYDLSRWVVLMDVLMPGLDGMEATRVLRGRGYVMPIFALTANVMQEDRDKAKASGMDGFICKPLRLEELEAGIHTAVEGMAKRQHSQQEDAHSSSASTPGEE